VGIPDFDFASHLQHRIDVARARWPGVRVDLDALRQRVADDLGPNPSAERLHALNLEDLYLAIACARRDPAALGHLDALLVLPPQVRRLADAHALGDEVLQQVRQKLVMGAPPRILEYTGRGALVRWLRVVVVRTAISLRRSERATDTAEDLESLLSAPDPEIDFIKLSDRVQLQRALTGSIDTLDARARALLRLHHLDGVSLDQLARLHDVHRATVARWLAEARTELLERTRERLRETLRLSSREVDSWVRLVQSRLDADAFSAALKASDPGR
jgi:RNA polymerase sigma-70 factor (ECF subfamily)